MLHVFQLWLRGPYKFSSASMPTYHTHTGNCPASLPPVKWKDMRPLPLAYHLAAVGTIFGDHGPWLLRNECLHV